MSRAFCKAAFYKLLNSGYNKFGLAFIRSLRQIVATQQLFFSLMALLSGSFVLWVVLLTARWSFSA